MFGWKRNSIHTWHAHFELQPEKKSYESKLSVDTMRLFHLLKFMGVDFFGSVADAHKKPTLVSEYDVQAYQKKCSKFGEQKAQQNQDILFLFMHESFSYWLHLLCVRQFFYSNCNNSILCTP